MYNMNDDFIGVYDDVVPISTCINLINHFESLKKINLTYNRKITDGSNKLQKDDETAFLLHPDCININGNNSFLTQFTDLFWACYADYTEKYSVLQQHARHGIKGVNIQKTLPTQGYHIWHCENMSQNSANKIAAWSLFLNTIEEGGETEFIYLNRRIKPKQGTIIIWPAGYTHTHRGNPPIGQEKYLLTGHLEYISQ